MGGSSARFDRRQTRISTGSLSPVLSWYLVLFFHSTPYTVRPVIYRRVLQLAKARKVKISYSIHIHKTIREQWDAYIAAREEQEQIFKQLRESAAIIQQRGIHQGYCDDTELDKAIKYSWRITEIARESNAAWQITGFTHRLLETEQYLADHGEHGDMIAL